MCKRLAVALFAGGTFAALPLAAQIGGHLPLDTALSNARPIIVELDNATIQVAVDPSPTTKSWLRAATARPEDDPAAGALAIDWQEGPITVRRAVAPAADETPVRVLVELTVLARQPLVIKGSDLDVTVTTAADLRARYGDSGGKLPPPRPRQLTPSPPATGEKGYNLEIEVEGSRIDLFGVREALVIAAASRLRSERSSGLLVVEAKDDAEGEILDHRGPLELRATDSDLAVQGTLGQVRFDLRQSNAVLRDGQGAVEGSIGGGLLVVDNWRGGTVIKDSSNASLDVRGDVANNNLEIAGEELEVTIAGWHGSIQLDQEGGRLRTEGCAGPSTMQLAGTRFELTQMRGPLAMEMTDGASGKLLGLEGQLNGKIARSEIELRDVFSLDLAAQRATITGGGIRRLRGFEVTSSTVDLDLSATAGILDVKLRGETKAALELKTPCAVMVEAEAAPRVKLDGCTIQVGYASPSQVMARPAGGGRSTLLRAVLDAAAELEVSGTTPQVGESP
ncbi:MAG: hypothetical protein D6696_03185 [Acidobacteria bacterium]|nr:MAG: hypothetical protein D6696_03185 [Acidobacteriota bacterium]